MQSWNNALKRSRKKKSALWRRFSGWISEKKNRKSIGGKDTRSVGGKKASSYIINNNYYNYSYNKHDNDTENNKYNYN